MVAGGAVVLAATQAVAQGCAMCGTAIAPDDPLASALNTSILFLMAAPYTLVGSAALWLYVQHRRRRPQSRGGVVAFARDAKEE
jgi:hypothetical protein